MNPRLDPYRLNEEALLVPPSEHSDRDPLIGLALGQYIVREKLAEGGMGAVYIMEQPRLKVRKVLKVLLREYANHPVIRARFEREATAAARLKHRSIITIDDFGALPDGQLYLVMPFLDGKSLEAHLRQRGALNIYDTLHIIAQVLAGLQNLHDAGIVHRDLKPGNIFITREDDSYKVTLLDLGIARDVAEEATTLKTDTGMSMGTPGYMAPEQYGNASNATPAADIYAVGIILWEMLTGQRPWNAPSATILYHLQLTERPKLPAGVALPPEVLALLQRLLEKEPWDRPASAREVAIAFASMVPAIPPHVPSGAEILAKVARELVMHATPMQETVRNQGDRAPAAVIWTPQGTHVPSLPIGTPADPFSAPLYTPTPQPAPVPTVNQRPGAIAQSASPTPALPSIGGAAAPSTTSNTGRILAIGLVGALVVGIGTFVLASKRRHHSESSAAGSDAATVASPNTAVPDAAIHAAEAPTPAVAPVVVPPNAPPLVPLDAAAPPSVSTATVPTTRSHAHPHAVANESGVHATTKVAPATGSAAAPLPKKFDPDAVEN